MRRFCSFSGAIAAILIVVGSGTSSAAPLSAIVEEISVERADVAFMDYLRAGRKISLGESGRLVVGYLKSCLREVIVGGTVTIGSMESIVVGGTVHRKRVECDGGRLLLSAEEAAKSGVVVFRKRGSAGGSQSPSLRIYSVQPLVQVGSKPASVNFERLDHAGMTMTVILRDGVTDFLKNGRSLEAGGLYRVSGGGRERIFRVDADAVAGGSLIGRLIAF